MIVKIFSDSKVPGEKEWQGINLNDIDERYTYDLFFGKSNEEMQEEYLSRYGKLHEELAYMPDKAFQYYVLGYRDFVAGMDPSHPESSEVINAFLNLIEKTAHSAPHRIFPVFGYLRDTVESVGKNQEKYGAHEHIYGDLSEVIFRIFSRMADIANFASD